MSYGYDYSLAAQAAGSERAAFIRRTYAHLAGAILAFMGVEALLLNMLSLDQQQMILNKMGGYGWLVVMLAFMGASWLAQTLGAVGFLPRYAVRGTGSVCRRRSDHLLAAAHHRHAIL